MSTINKIYGLSTKALLALLCAWCAVVLIIEAVFQMPSAGAAGELFSLAVVIPTAVLAWPLGVRARKFSFEQTSKLFKADS